MRAETAQQRQRLRVDTVLLAPALYLLSSANPGQRATLQLGMPSMPGDRPAGSRPPSTDNAQSNVKGAQVLQYHTKRYAPPQTGGRVVSRLANRGMPRIWKKGRNA